MVVPEDGAGVKKWRVTTRNFFRIKMLLGISVLLLVAGFFSTLSLGVVYMRMKHFQRSNVRLLEATRKLDDVLARLDTYQQKERLLRDLLGGDIELPKAPEEEPVISQADNAGKTASSGAMTGGSLNEIEQAIARQESAMRRKPSIWPIENVWQLSDRFRDTGFAQGIHQGIDIVAPAKTTVMAVADGRVIFAGMDETLGQMIGIDHENGWETRYGHNRLLLVKFGDMVRKGQPIAIYGGKGGYETGPHLHFAMYYKGKAMNPLDHLPPKPGLEISER